MQESEMTCDTCFYNGLRDRIEPSAHVQCRAEPDHRLFNPNYKWRCGRGRWWENGKWIRWIDKE